MNPQNVDITQLPVTELKALAYDVLGQIELYQRNLQVVNGEIAKRADETVGSVPASDLVIALDEGADEAPAEVAQEEVQSDTTDSEK